jgi:FlaG/FlaF family flagellin (archaellin)
MRLLIPSHGNTTIPSFTEEMLQKTPVQRPKGGNATTGRLITHPRGLNITFKHQCKEKSTANLKTNCGKKTVKQKWKKQNTIKYTTWNVRGTAHKEEEMGSVLNGEQIKIAAITESKTKLKGTTDTNSYKVI